MGPEGTRSVEQGENSGVDGGTVCDLQGLADGGIGTIESGEIRVFGGMFVVGQQREETVGPVSQWGDSIDQLLQGLFQGRRSQGGENGVFGVLGSAK